MEEITDLNLSTGQKHEQLKEIFRTMGKALVAFSGGVDSTLLLKVAIESLGNENVLAVTALSPLYPERELRDAKKAVDALGARHLLIESNELEIPGFSKNPVNRCYYCKKKLFEELAEIGRKEGVSYVVEGSTLDDDKDHRPGKIAIRELGIRSPLKEAMFTKQEVRELSHDLGLATWDKPSFACLASRFPYGEEITPEALGMVNRAEEFLFTLGFRQVRVRHYQRLARIELFKEEMGRLLDETLRESIVRRLKEIGYQYITLDLQGFRSGSMNEVLG
jgi:pyridinium-3,5-biscarboxylic acid mononucleotide sulfurtransferase